MNTFLFISTLASFAVSGYLLGWLAGRDDNRTNERAWCDGYAAGLAKADQMYPSVNRLETR
jgi:hypothetical protein